MKRVSIALAVLGLILGLALISYYGADAIIAAIGRIGPAEFALILGWQLVIFAILGLAWHTITPREAPRGPWALIWARMVRDATATCLPFSQVGGFVLGTRAATLHGLKWQTATASMVVDLTAEFLAQIAFAAIGLGILLAHVPSSGLIVPLEIGIGLAVAGGVAFIAMQKGAGPIFAALGRRIAGNRLDNAQERVAVLQAEVALIHGHTPRLIFGFLLHLLGWAGMGVAGWLTLRLLDVPIPFDQALAIEALVAAVAAIAFLVPVNAGVQEAGYVGLGAVFGVPPDIAIAVSLIRRARDVTLGVPILLTWQLVEVRRLRRAD